MKALRFALMSVLFSCVFQSIEAMADHVYGSSSIVNDVANNTVKGYSRTELDYDTAAYYTAYVCGELFKEGVSQVRACQGGFITASINTQFTGVSSASSVLSDHYVDMQYYDEGNQSYEDYSGYSFLPGYSYRLTGCSIRHSSLRIIIRSRFTLAAHTFRAAAIRATLLLPSTRNMACH